MGEIPEDVRLIAHELAMAWAMPESEKGAYDAIAHAIASERKRCAEVARKIKPWADGGFASEQIALAIESGQ